VKELKEETDDVRETYSRAVPIGKSVCNENKNGRRQMSVGNVRVMLVDYLQSVREGIATLFFEEEKIELLAQTSDAESAIQLTCALVPDVLIIDPYLPNLFDGQKVLREVRHRVPNVKTLCFSSSADFDDIDAMLNAGAAGYVAKRNGREKIVEAVLKISSGDEYYLCPIATGSFLAQKKIRQHSATRFATLTKREREMFEAFALGNDTGTISSMFHISMDTVATHRRNILKKLSLKSIPNLIWFAIENKIVSICRSGKQQ
jgi:DNA-binding NarL/FixJ family response regulator